MPFTSRRTSPSSTDKRTALNAALVFLDMNGWVVQDPDMRLYDAMIGLSSLYRAPRTPWESCRVQVRHRRSRGLATEFHSLWAKRSSTWIVVFTAAPSTTETAGELFSTREVLQNSGSSSRCTWPLEGMSSCSRIRTARAERSFVLGKSILVAASRRGGQLLASECPLLSQDTVKALRSLLGVPETSPAGLLPRSWDFSPQGCSQPATLDDAFSIADAVVWGVPRASCVVGEADVVEHAMLVGRAWKGPAAGDIVTVRVTGRADNHYADFPLAVDLANATNHPWPPAEFVRRDDDRYVNDGCLSPLPPATLQEGVEQLTRLLPVSGARRPGHTTCLELPVLSCGTLDRSSRSPPNALRQRTARVGSSMKNQRCSGRLGGHHRPQDSRVPPARAVRLGTVAESLSPSQSLLPSCFGDDASAPVRMLATVARVCSSSTSQLGCRAHGAGRSDSCNAASTPRGSWRSLDPLAAWTRWDGLGHA